MTLSNGTTWGFQSTEATVEWLNKFASIMELKASSKEAEKRIIFVNKAEQAEIQRAFNDWTNHGKITFFTIESLCFWYNARESLFICDIGDNTRDKNDYRKMSLSLYPISIYMYVLKQGGFPFHGALIERNGVGFLITAPGGTGKTTCCRRLPAGWHVLSDDDTVVLKGENELFTAHPFPTWSEFIYNTKSTSTWNVEHGVPLKSIIFLQQSESDEILNAGTGMISVLIYGSISGALYYYKPDIGSEVYKKLTTTIIENACELAKKIPAFILQVGLTGRFWEKIDEILFTVDNCT